MDRRRAGLYALGAMTSKSMIELVTELEGAALGAAAAVGREPIGVRAVEPSVGERWYLCAFEGPAFLCLDRDNNPERTRRNARHAAGCALLVEHAESLLDPAELDLTAGVAGRVGTVLDDDAVVETLSALEADVASLAAWRGRPERAIASLPALETAIALHDVARAGFERFIAASEPLVSIQDTLPEEVVAGLRDLEEAAHRAGLARSLALAVSEAIAVIDAGTEEILDLHLTPLDGGAAE
jgi:hypothetical protein